MSEREKPSKWAYLPPRPYYDDPIDRLPGGDEMRAELTEVIEARLATGERHIHAKRGGCPTCASAAADAAVRYLERNTRVIASDALAPDEHGRASAAMKAMPYLGTHFRLAKGLGRDPDFPTVGHLLDDLDDLRREVQALVEKDRQREGELRRYRQWREAVAALAVEVVEMFDPLAVVPPSAARGPERSAEGDGSTEASS